MEKNGNKIVSFSHDVNSRNDIKIIYLINEMGYEGYGIFWSILELIFQNDGSIPNDVKLISSLLKTTEDKIVQVITKYNLFVIEDNKLTSPSIKRRISKSKINTSESLSQDKPVDKNKYLGEDIANVVYDLDMLNGKVYLCKDYIDKMSKAYPNVNIETEINFWWRKYDYHDL